MSEIKITLERQKIPPKTEPLAIIPTESEQAFTADGDLTGFTPVTVEAINATELTATENGEYTPSENEYYKKVNVNVEQNELLYANSGRSYTKNIVLPNTVTSIGEYAYYGCEQLQSIAIPYSVTLIGTLAFWGCVQLQSVAIPNSVTTINGRAFMYCHDIETVKFEHGCTTIGLGMFSGCTSLNYIELPNTIQTIGTYNDANSNSFYGCTSLKNVALENGFLASIRLSASTLFTNEDIANMFNALGIVPSGETRTMSLGATNLNKLTAEQKAIATNKGWTLA